MTDPDSQTDETVLERLARWAFAAALLGFGLFFMLFGSHNLASGLEVRDWPEYQCEVLDLRVETRPRKEGQLYFEGYRIYYDLIDLQGGQVYRHVPYTVPETVFWQRSNMDHVILPYSPGSITDCRLAPDGKRAAVQARSGWAMTVYSMNVFFGLLFIGTGALLLKSSLYPELGRRLAACVQFCRTRLGL